MYQHINMFEVHYTVITNSDSSKIRFDADRVSFSLHVYLSQITGMFGYFVVK